MPSKSGALTKLTRSKLEWSMGCGGDQNAGQCPVCDGVSLAWREAFGGWGNEVGHERDCELAKALEAEGEKVLWVQPYPLKKK